MKKIFLIVGLAFGCSSVYAQVVTQTGDDNTVLTTTDESFNGSTYTVTQTNDWNYATITQKGAAAAAASSIILSQVSVPGVGIMSEALKNIFIIVQEGSNNKITSEQIGKKNGAIIRQLGTSANGVVNTDQYGYKNSIGLYQNAGTDNYAKITQGTDGPAARNGLPTATSRNNVVFTQTGDGGKITVTQTGDAASLKGSQTGGGVGAALDNVITVTQTTNSWGDVIQAGSNNTVTAKQKGYQYFKAEQGTSASNGTITVNQDPAAGVDARNQATVSQTAGDGNKATVTQNGPLALKNNATITQSGTKAGALVGTVAVEQKGPRGWAEIQQSGVANAVSATQEGSTTAGSSFMLQQSGEKNGFTTTQKGESNRVVGALEGYTFAQQSGELGVATVSQDGKLHQAAVNQAGKSNTLTITQTVEENKAVAGQATGTETGDIKITQSAKKNTATVNQTAGKANEATVNQTEDGNTATVAQSGTWKATGPVTSTVILNQLGKTGTISATQSGVANKMEFTQNLLNGEGNKATLGQSGQSNSLKGVQAGKNNETTLTQSGNDGVLRSGQVGEGNKILATTQAGEKNQLAVGQSGKNNEATYTQAGTDNYGVVIQAGTNKATATQAATTSKNTVAIVQSNYGNGSGPGATAIVTAFNALPRSADAMGTAVLAAEMSGAFVPATGDMKPTTDNTATVSQQSGKDNTVLLGQLGNVNTATVTQAGDNLEGVSVQAGNNGQSTIVQGGKMNKAGVMQMKPTGNTTSETPTNPNPDSEVLIATITQNAAVSESEAKIKQQGQINTATITQVKGTKMSATIDQTEAKNNSRNNTGTITQEVTLEATGVAGVFTGYDNTDPYNPIPQYGSTTNNNLTATITQQGRKGKATIDQKGVLNSASIEQKLPYSLSNEGTIIQNGSANKANIQQYGGSQIATIEQGVGLTNSSANVNQGVVGSFTVGFANAPDFFTNGNVATVKQIAGDDNQITLNQNNERNTATLTQESGKGNRILISQTPSDPAEVAPSPYPGGNNNQPGNKATVTQKTGDNNMAKLNQTGYNNTLTLTQDGGGNILRKQAGGLTGDDVAVQSGFGGTATLLQTGMGHIINLNQGGVGNIATITQMN